MKDNIRLLKEPFPFESLKWRLGNKSKDKTKANMLVYIDARNVMDRLDNVVGPENWQDSYEVFGGTTNCTISIKVNGEWISKTDGAGDTNVEAEKGANSDAFKRAAVKWGIGRYLYEASKYNTWVSCEGISDFNLYKEHKSKLDGVASKISDGVDMIPTSCINEMKDFMSLHKGKFSFDQYLEKFEAKYCKLNDYDISNLKTHYKTNMGE